MGLTAAPVPNLLQSSASGVEGQGKEGRSEAEPGKKGWRLVRKVV